MICLNCGKTVDDDVRVCPFCGSLIESSENAAYESAPPVQEEPLAPPPVSDRIPDEDAGETFYDDDPVYREPKKAAPGASLAAGFLSPAAIFSLIACVLSVVCLINVTALRRELKSQSELVIGNVGVVGASVSALDGRLAQLDTTVAGVQSEAYNQLASQSIIIMKDITPLVGPVDAGKYNRMFIISAKGNLNVNDSFDWQKYNESTGGWVSVVFTGDATNNVQYGLRLENTYDKSENTYTSILWANGITAEASGTYRCVVTDATGITKISAEATVSVV
jgi:hypothetical protein